MGTRFTKWGIHGAASLAIVALITLLYYRVVQVNSTTVALTLVLAILAVATWWGLGVASAMAVAAMLCFNYFFLPPIGTFIIADPQNWVALAVFLITAIVASQLSASAKQQAKEALERQQEVERLYDLSRNLLLGDSSLLGNPLLSSTLLGNTSHGLAGEIPHRLRQTFGADAVSFFDRGSGVVFRSGTAANSSPDSVLKDTALQGTFQHDAAKARFLVPVSLGGHVTGSLEVLGGAISEAAVQAVANLLAIALEREAALNAALQADTARGHEELKSTLLDALAHELKTPLTSIKAAVTALLDNGSAAATQHELLTVVNEETDRLSGMVTEAIQMARIEAGQLKLSRQAVAPGALVYPALEQLQSRLDGRPVRVTIDPGLGPVQADAELISITVQQLLDNAAKYSPPQSPLEVSVQQQDGKAVITVADHGSGVPQPERTRIFDKFYRGRGARERIPGTGMGLAIAREIVKAHGGEIWVDSHSGQGAEFSFTLPLS
jgi:two-component system sensor histidine kinase KdpD